MDDSKTLRALTQLSAVEQYITSAAHCVQGTDPDTAALLDLALLNLEGIADAIADSTCVEEVCEVEVVAEMTVALSDELQDHLEMIEKRVRRCELGCKVIAKEVGLAPGSEAVRFSNRLEGLENVVSQQSKIIELLLKDKVDGPFSKDEFSNRYEEIVKPVEVAN